MRLDDRPADRQPQAHAMRLGRVEHLEDPGFPLADQVGPDP